MKINDYLDDDEYIDNVDMVEFNNKRRSINEKRRDARRKLEDILEMRKLHETIEGYTYTDMK
ncbi:MAG: hypothetical protein OQK73_05835 [Gammaproteobacteria bacterium]|nr:hypothetical protein [Gammaproteobacteria bacterium]